MSIRVITLMTFDQQPQELPVADFISPEGFEDTHEQPARPAERTIFIARPSAEAGNHCSYLLDEAYSRLYLPNTVKCFLNHVELITVNYDDQLYGAQEKLLMHFTSIGGDAFVWRVGATSYAASSLVLACTYLNSTALTGQLEVTWVAKGAAVFARVASANNDGFTPVALPKEALGHKLSMDELMDGMTFINQSINTGDAVPPRFFNEPQEDEQAPGGLDTVLEELRAPTKRRRKTTAKAVESAIA